TPDLKAAFIECSYPNAKKDLARISKHLTPALLETEFRKLGRENIAVYAYHLKPAYKDEIVRELAELRLPSLSVLEEGQTITIYQGVEKVPPALFSHRSEAQRTGKSTLRLLTRCGRAGRSF